VAISHRFGRAGDLDLDRSAKAFSCKIHFIPLGSKKNRRPTGAGDVPRDARETPSGPEKSWTGATKHGHRTTTFGYRWIKIRGCDAIIQSDDAADSASGYQHDGQWNAALRTEGGHENLGDERRDA
jgi:hypothetical protein